MEERTFQKEETHMQRTMWQEALGQVGELGLRSWTSTYKVLVSYSKIVKFRLGDFNASSPL